MGDAGVVLTARRTLFLLFGARAFHLGATFLGHRARRAGGFHRLLYRFIEADEGHGGAAEAERRQLTRVLQALAVFVGPGRADRQTKADALTTNRA